MPAPIALFVFNRPWHTEQTINALKKNELSDLSDLFIFCDGPRSEADTDKVKSVRELVKKTTGFRSIKIIESSQNYGLAASVISGVTQVLEEYDSIIVLEDDMITSTYFLSYMNQALSLYAADDRVISISGYMYPIAEELPETFFIKSADCWSWATWRRGWSLFETDTNKLLKLLIKKGTLKKFDFDNSYPYTRMLIMQYFKQIDSWAIRWYASAFFQDKLSLYPKKSLIQNIGFDNSGTHTKSWSKKSLDVEIYNEPIHVNLIEVKEDLNARKILANYFLKKEKTTIQKIIRKIRSVFN